MKNLLKIGFMSLVGLGVLASCSSGKINGGNENQTLSAKEKDSIQAVTSMNLLSSLSGASLRSANVLGLAKEDKGNLEKMLPTIDLLLDNGYSFTSQVEEKENVILEETFKYEETLSFKDENLTDKTYKLFYNETFTKVEEDKDDKDEKEENKVLKGYAMIDGTNYYAFKSLSTKETEEDEVEEERTFRIDIDQKNYIVVNEEHEIEDGEKETSFDYLVVKDGQKTLEYSIELEKDKNDDEIEYEINDKEYKMKRKTLEGVTYYQVFFGDDDDDNKAIITYKKIIAEDGTVSYEEVVA